jgi:hypothetical protein
MSDLAFPLPTGDPSVLPAGANLDRAFDGACRIAEGPAVSPDDLFQRHHVYRIVQGSVWQVPGGRQHLEMGPKDQTGDHFSLAKRHVERDAIRCRRQSHRLRRGRFRRSPHHQDRYENGQKLHPDRAL